ncbi:MarR family transcriptional regulator [Candidatus Roizmanbacteria bacterium]|nr:MarR family transcriptional regulator [Candidatus Roizmanbacteria bacterium]
MKSVSESTKTTALNEQLIDVMVRLSRITRHHMAIHSSLKQLTLLQLDTLIFLDKHPHAQMLDISTYFHITKPTATAMLHALVRMNLVERKLNENDRRIVHVYLTEMGSTLLKDALKQKQKKAKLLLSVLSDDDKKNLLRILSAVLTEAQNQYETQ